MNHNMPTNQYVDPDNQLALDTTGGGMAGREVIRGTPPIFHPTPEQLSRVMTELRHRQKLKQETPPTQDESLLIPTTSK